jgi:hypothetical protein
MIISRSTRAPLLLLPLLLAACASGKASVDENGAGGGDGGDGGADGSDGATPAAAFTVDPASVELPPLLLGQSAAVSLTVTNTGDLDLALTAEIAAADAAAWTVDLAEPALAPGAASALELSVVPSDWGNYDATLTVSDEASGETVLVSITLDVQIDADGDGYGSIETGGGDCDDADLSVSPGADEIWYDGIDQNCDGADDYDQDGDGVIVDDDCDDTDPSSFPGNEEEWYNGVDNACDGGDDYDQDGDGVTVDEDCDDTDPDVLPGVPEIWYDGVDQNCDGADDYDQDGDGVTVDTDCDDEDPLTYPGAPEIWYNGVDNDCAGGDDYDQDGDGVASPTDCNDIDPTITGPEDEVVDGIDNDCSGVVDDFPITDHAAGVIYGGASAGIGNNTTLAVGGDVTGDGGEDAYIGSPLSSSGTSGYVWVVEGVDLVGAAAFVGDVDAALATGGGYYYAVANVSGPMVDLTGDGAADLLTASAGSYGYGYAWVFDGPMSGTSTIYETPSYFTGDSSGDNMRVAASGDIDGDGVADVVTGSPGDNNGSGATQVGNLSAFQGPVDEDYDLSDAEDQLHGSTSYDYLGYSVSVADWTGDGYADILSGAYGQDSGASGAGALYLFAGDSTMTWSATTANSAAALRVAGLTASGALGADALPTPCDLDGDGSLDLVAASETTGGAWVFFNDGALSGQLDVGAADIGLSGAAFDFGSAIACASDLNGDGALDLLVGDDGNDTAGSNAGAVWIFPGAGALSGALTAADAGGALWGAAAGDALGSGLAAGADLTGDGQDDVLVGAAGSSAGASGGGAVYLLDGWD